MAESKWKPLNGEKNKRINNCDLKNSSHTFPLADTQRVDKVSGITIPSEEDVFHAKEWVDDGSLL